MKMKLFILGAVVISSILLSACGSKGKKNSIPTEWEECDTPGRRTCGQDALGREAVLVCVADENGNWVWKVLKICDTGCKDDDCVQPPTPPMDVDAQDATETAEKPVDIKDEYDVVDVVEIPDVGVKAETYEVEVEVLEDVCVPQCEGKVCGPDGCGGSCGECPEGAVCINDGTECCVPDCFGKACGPDGCGGSCGECPEGMECNAYFQCAPPCEPKCEGKECGPDGCGGSCGECPEGWACGPDGHCTICIPDCEGKECGDDGCGGSCGACPYGTVCIDYKCVECIPDCFGKECGDDGCGGSCGECPPGEICNVNGQCELVCVPQCQGKECGPDGCGGLCGKCPEYAWCSPEGKCITECQPDCEGKECGDDGCGGSCGTCPQGSYCSPDGKCVHEGDPCGSIGPEGWCDGLYLLLCINNQITVTNCLTVGKNVACEWLPALNSYGCREHGECVPNCQGKECGDDGCGGSCGTCPFGKECVNGECKGQTECGNITYKGCCDGNTVVWCDNGILWFMDCSQMLDPNKQHCGWNPNGYYDCVSEPVPGPPEYPMWCEGTCVPNCTNKQCGDDGCGGSCGTCPPGLECINNQCVGPDGGCGPYTEESTCVDDYVVWCEDGHIVFYDCKKMGPDYHCGWVPELYMNYCKKEECIPDCEGKECGPDGCGYVCGYCPVTMYCNDLGKCVYGSGLCGDIDYVGECQGNTVVWCQNGVLQSFDCSNLGPDWVCAFWEEGGYYWCVQQGN